uniref:Nitroreductase domain-containing protein n=1 Tax=Panagrellus redivivus TaxID=6233 RepID=A0A7E4V8M2_PANRE
MMNLFAEAAEHQQQAQQPQPLCAIRAASGQCLIPSASGLFDRFKMTGYVKQLLASVDAWHLNALSAFVVTVFVYFQLRSMFVVRPRPKQALATESFNKKPVKKREYADKQVGDDLDVVDDHDEFQNAKEVPYRGPVYTEDEMLRRSQLFYESMKLRRSVRCFSPRTVPMKIIQNIIKTAGTSPSGANLQPWTFCVIADEAIKVRIREIVETEEQINYSRRMGAKWVLDVEHLNVNWNKPYLTEAPYLIVIMKQTYQILENNQRQPTYYNEISTCIATGFLLAAIHNVGLVTVTTTPLNAGGQIRELLQRPVNEKVVLLLPVGYPAENTHVPDIRRKKIEEIIRLY